MAACDLSQLVADSACLNCLGESENEAVFLSYLAKAVNTLGGGNYTDLPTLRQAVSCWCVGGLALDAFKARVAVNSAVNAGAVAAPTIAQIREVIKCWSCGIGGQERKAMEVFLLCKLLQL